jgi:hypothetical protein
MAPVLQRMVDDMNGAISPRIPSILIWNALPS